MRVPPILMQPVAARDVSAELANIVLDAPLGGMAEIGGPERLRLDDLARRLLLARDDKRPVVADPQARYYGTPVDDASLVAGDDARLGAIRFTDWLKQNGR